MGAGTAASVDIVVVVGGGGGGNSGTSCPLGPVFLNDAFIFSNATVFDDRYAL